MRDINNVEFETVIKNINKLIVKKNGPVAYPIDKNHSLCMIYDFDKLNEHGKIIMKRAEIYITKGTETFDIWAYKYFVTYDFKDLAFETRIEAVKDFVQQCSYDENLNEAYKFIFWALMILTVDKTDMEEHLSMICDFAQLLHISDDELEDIVRIIKYVYGLLLGKFEFKTKNIPVIFESLIDWGLKQLN